MKAANIAEKYINFFKKQGHKQILNSPLVPQNDPTTLFTSSGMQPLVPYLLGEAHPQGCRLVNVQNSFRAVDIDEIGDNRHTTFFRMLGNWSLGDYFKKEQLPWIYEFLTKELKLDPHKLYVTVFAGDDGVERDDEAIAKWTEIFKTAGIEPKGRIFQYGVDKNWWSRSGPPKKMPTGEPGGPDSEIFYDFGADLKIHEKSPFKNQKCHVNCDCGRFIEIANSVFMQYKKEADGTLKLLRKPNVDFGGGLERMLLATENQPDAFQTSLFSPIIKTIEEKSKSKYKESAVQMRIIVDHIVASCFIVAAGVKPSKTEQGYVLRRLIRRAVDNLLNIHGQEGHVESIILSVVEQYRDTDPVLVEKYEMIKFTILDETEKYKNTLRKANSILGKAKIVKVSEQTITGKADIVKPVGDELMGIKEISVSDAFLLYSSHGLSPTQIKSLGYTFDEQAFAQKLKEHQSLSRAGAEQKFRGGLADHQERTIMGHTATHLLHQALRDLLNKHVHQTGSNITTERVRFDFNYDHKLSDEQIKRLEDVVNEKIKENLPVHFELIPTQDAHAMGAIGLFMDTYGEKSKIYFIGGDSKQPSRSYSIEFCGGPHVDFTGRIKSFKIIKQENIGNKQRRIYAIVG
jgi:alanyl-tRNA synthetase